MWRELPKVAKIGCMITLASTGLLGRPQANTKPLTPPSPSNQPSPPQQQAAFTSQLKKTVVFITASGFCPPPPAELAAMSPEDRDVWNDYDPARLRPEQLARMAQKSFFGTGFIVLVPDDRLGKDMGFQYLVTDRHVALPGIEDGKPCKVVNYAISLNRKGAAPDSAPQLETLAAPEIFWAFPEDDSVDLAAAGFPLSRKDYDFMEIPLSQFVTQEMIQKGDVVEGDPAIFTGLFIQYAGNRILEPVVRSGTVAMLPSEEIQTTLRKPGHIYLAEVHAFGGNSGSPIFVDVNKFKNVLGYDYHLLGVVAGEVLESADLTLRVTTSYSGTVAANSDVSVIVPAFQVRDLLLSRPFQQARDAYVSQHPATQPTGPQPAK